VNFQAIALAIGAAFFSHTAFFRVGPKRVTISVTTGPPVHFTFALALTGAEAALAGQSGVVAQSGNVAVTVDNWPT
jgi:hypothetical protein